MGAGAAIGSGCATMADPEMERQAQASRPNVLWIMTDEQRRDSMAAYGSSWAHMPHLDRLAAEGVVFHHAYTPSPVCQPARCAMLTGLPCWETGVWSNDGNLERPLPHLTERFHEAGYQSATFGKQHYGTTNPAFQTQAKHLLSDDVGYFGYAPEFDQNQYDVVQYPPEPYAWIFGGRFPTSMERTAEYQAVQAAKAWLDERDTERPFLLRLSLNAPHTPVAVPEPFDSLVPEEAVQYPAQTESIPEGAPAWITEHLSRAARSDRLSADEIRKARRYYYGFTAFLDAMVGDLLTWMEERGLLDNTIVAFLSDHGTHIGDFGLMQKQTFYEPSVSVPYFFWYPRGIAQGAVMETPVDVATLLPTVLELAGLPTPASPVAPSLAGCLRSGGEPVTQPVFSGLSLASFDMIPADRMVMVRDGAWKLTLRFTSQFPEHSDGFLVNLTDDPYEQHNLIGQAPTQQNRLTDLICDALADPVW